MTTLNITALSHPRSQWEIRACLQRAIEYGSAIAMSAAGTELVTAIHDRDAVPAFSFWRGCVDITEEFLPILRSHGREGGVQ